MSNSTISTLPSGAPAQATDAIPVARSGTNVKLLVSDITGLVVLKSPGADQTVNDHSVLPASGNTTQTLGNSAAPWNATLNTASVKSLETILYADQFSGADIGAKVNAAVAALPGGGGKVIIPAGTFSFSTQILVTTANIIIQGAGSGGINFVPQGTAGSTVLKWTGGSTPAIVLGNGNGHFGITLRDLTIDNTGTGTYGVFIDTFFVTLENIWILPTTPFSAVGIGTGNTHTTAYLTFRQCHLENSAPCGFDIDKANLVNFDSTISNNHGTNFRIGNTSLCSAVHFWGCDSEPSNPAISSTAVGIDFINCVTGVVRDSYFESTQAGQLMIRLGSVSNIVIEGNYFQANAVGTYALKFNGVNNVTLVGNSFVGCVTSGVNNTSTTNGIDINNLASSGTPSVLSSDAGFAVSIGSSSAGSVVAVANSDPSLTPAITSKGAALVGITATSLGSGTGKCYGVIGIARGASDASGDKAYGGWFKANAQTNPGTEVGVHAEVTDGGGMIAEFYQGGSAKGWVDGTGALTLVGPTPTGSGSNLGIGNTSGFGSGTSGTAVTTTTKGAGSGPTTPQTIVKYLQVDIGGTKYWLGLCQ